MAKKEYIEREAFLDAIERMKPYHQDADDIAEMLQNFPDADVRPVVRAHWYWDKDGMDWNIGAWRCSACKAMSPMWWNTDRGSPMHKSGHNFCPNCGADMRPTSMSGANGEGKHENRVDRC